MALNITILRERMREVFGDDSQEVVGKKLNMTQGNVSKLLSGSQQPTIETICSIAEIYGVSVDWLLGISEKKRRVNIASYASATEMLTNLRNHGVVFVGKERTGKLYIRIEDPMLEALTKKSIALYDADTEVYCNWIDSGLSAFGDKPLLYKTVWDDDNVSFLASQVLKDSNWLQVYEAAHKVEEKYNEFMGDNPGPFGE